MTITYIELEYVQHTVTQYDHVWLMDIRHVWPCCNTCNSLWCLDLQIYKLALNFCPKGVLAHARCKGDSLRRRGWGTRLVSYMHVGYNTCTLKSSSWYVRIGNRSEIESKWVKGPHTFLSLAAAVWRVYSNILTVDTDVTVSTVYYGILRAKHSL